MKSDKTRKQAFFRLEASESVGAGHAIRSLVLADALLKRGWLCSVVSSEASYAFIPNLKRYKRIDPELFFCSSLASDLLVIDSYALGYDYESYFRPLMKKIMVIDDLQNRKHNCDLLLDQTYARSPIDYKYLVPDGCKILTGARYTLLRDDFVTLRSKAFLKREKLKTIKTVLISLGGSDSSNYIIIKILEILKNSAFCGHIHLVLGFSSENTAYIHNYLQKYRLNVTTHINPDMAKLTYESDIAIGGAGSSMWERCCLGLPTFMIILSEDQSIIAQNIHNAKAAINLGLFDSLDINDAAICIKNTITDMFKIRELTENAFNICDGSGVDRVIEEIEYAY